MEKCTPKDRNVLQTGRHILCNIEIKFFFEPPAAQCNTHQCCTVSTSLSLNHDGIWNINRTRTDTLTKKKRHLKATTISFLIRCELLHRYPPCLLPWWDPNQLVSAISRLPKADCNLTPSATFSAFVVAIPVQIQPTRS